ncbi:MAG: insulinase family protein, partial [Clostridia bacterium]|nr:insulinase family protein [Clostridia bacterium]
ITTEKDIEQIHFSLGFCGEKFDSDKTDALSLVNVILGTGMSSRLFQRVREELGLCYTIYSYPSGYKNVGTVAVYAGVNTESFTDALNETFSVLKNIKKGISEKEFSRGKAQLISSFAFSEESTASQMALYGKYLLFTGKVFDIDAKVKSINSLSLETINSYLYDMDFDDYSLSIVGRDVNVFDLK